ncbi:MAG: DUF4159 domain-containing protein [Deltaproteobacteria bacterium]|nr:DUF4159 domain-containing protein [Deltaproteobacteria bacterium]
MSDLSRRQMLLGSAACVALGTLSASRRAQGIGPASKFQIAQLILGNRWNPHPTALRRLLWEIDKRTSIDVSLEPAPVRLEARKLHQVPFLYLAGDRSLPLVPAQEMEVLRRFLTFGGFLLIDSAEGRAGGTFDASVRRLVGEIWPRPAPGLEPVPRDHVLYKSFYLVEQPVGRVLVAPQLEAVFRDKRAAVVYCQNDLGGAYARDNYGNWEHECYPGGESQREHAFRLGINLAMHALCLDYKTDQVHVPFILKRRRWKTGP